MKEIVWDGGDEPTKPCQDCLQPEKLRGQEGISPLEVLPCSTDLPSVVFCNADRMMEQYTSNFRPVSVWHFVHTAYGSYRKWMQHHTVSELLNSTLCGPLKQFLALIRLLYLLSHCHHIFS